MKKIFSSVILTLTSLLIILPLGIGFFALHAQHTSHHSSFCIEHCIETLAIPQEKGLTIAAQEIIGKILLGLPISFFFIAWIFSYFFLFYFQKYFSSQQINFYLQLIGSLKSRT